MKNPIEEKICETVMTINKQARRIAPLFSAFIGNPKDKSSLERGFLIEEDAMYRIEELETAIETHNYRNPLIALMIKDTLTLMSRGTDVLADITVIYPEAKVCYNVKMKDAVRTFDDFYDKHTKKWEDITKKWED